MNPSIEPLDLEQTTKNLEIIPTNLTAEERELWNGKREFLMRKLQFPREEAVIGANTAVYAFRRFFAA